MPFPLSHQTDKKLSAGEPQPLGATIKKEGVNFAVYSKYARQVFLLLFEKPDGHPTDIIRLDNRTEHVWHVFIHGVKAGQLYGYKVLGEYNPAQGMRFNEYKLLMDPYAKAITACFKDQDALFLPYDVNATGRDLVMDQRDNTSIVPKSIVIDDAFDWGSDQRHDIALERLIIYEVHLKGFTAHHSSGVRHPGTYLGFVEKIPYLKELGINAVELLPIHESYQRDALLEKGLSEYWGYNTIGFFAPEASYSTCRSLGCQVKEFKTLVRELHKAGIEIILDVVYNHTGEGNELGPSVCFRGIDNPTYYALKGPAEQPYRYYLDDTGCGNTLNIENPQVLRLIMDSLRYWVDVMHVDGFRFDLASILARVKGGYSKDSVFFDSVSKDPVLSKVKLIAEPWDLRTYQVGNFPVLWSEWNGKFRDTLRRFIKADPGQVKDLAWRLTGSADLYGGDGRSPYNSINFITCHDGFTLNDLFSYNRKHNEANGEKNKDGADENYSWNCGVEGKTDDVNILNLRRQLIKNALCCLFFSLGTPMLLGGDELMRTQKGNNNAYCQDNEISWFDWGYVKKNPDIFEFCKKAIAFNKRYTILQGKKFLSGKDQDADNIPDVAWFGENLDGPSWDDPESRLLCYQLDGGESPSPLGEYFLFFILNADVRSHIIRIPSHEGMKWRRVVDTSLEAVEDFFPPGKEVLLDPADRYQANSRSIVVLMAKGFELK